MYVPMTCIVIHFKEPNLRKTNLPIFPEKKFEHLLHPYFVICRRICSFTLYIHNYLKAGKPIKNKDWKCTRHLWQKFWYFEASRLYNSPSESQFISVSYCHHCFGYNIVCLQKTPLCHLALFYLFFQIHI